MSSKTEVLSFDDWARFQGLPLEKDDNGLYVNRHTHYARKGWEAKPEKAEVDELKKRIESAMEILEYNEYADSALQALEILKGEETK